MTEKELVIGTRNKKGIIKKIKWLPDHVIISREEYIKLKSSETLRKEKVQKALNKCFEHTLIYKGIIQIFPNATYHIDGKKVVELYKELGIKNE